MSVILVKQTFVCCSLPSQFVRWWYSWTEIYVYNMWPSMLHCGVYYCALYITVTTCFMLEPVYIIWHSVMGIVEHNNINSHVVCLLVRHRYVSLTNVWCWLDCPGETGTCTELELQIKMCYVSPILLSVCGVRKCSSQVELTLACLSLSVVPILSQLRLPKILGRGPCSSI